MTARYTRIAPKIFLTTKDDPAEHGFGLMKMRSIAEKYGSVLDVSYDKNRFSVMTALRLKA